MSVEIWPRVRELFERALELAPSERAAFVARESADAPLVQRELRRLLANWSDDSNFLAPPGATRLGDQLSVLASGPLSGKLGAYTLERLLGAGGMGSVYLARQERPDRHVALKLMRAGLGTGAAERHFEAEAEILARLSHPSIAAIYESGVHAGAPFFAMEYVEGALDLASFADGRQLELRARIELFLPVCDAVQHAHGKGVIHRDLKPSNVLVSAAGAPKVIDFGVARIVAPELAHSVGTLGGQALGTLAYAAPEQLQGDWRDVDVRADVYSLGATLFELLAGAPPFDVGSLPPLEALRTVCERPAPTLASVRAPVPRELDWVVQRCLAKERERRYTTVDELRRDLERWLAGEPLVAAPPSALYRARKFVARNRVAVAAAAIVFASLVTALVISVSKTREADEQRRIAMQASQASERDAESARSAALEADEQRRLATQASEQAARDAEAAGIEARRRQAVIDSLASMLGAVSPDEDGRNVTLFELLERRRSNLESEFADDPRLRVQLQGFLIKAYGDLGLATHGLELAESSLATMEREGGYTPSEISAMQFFVARRYFERGRMEDGAQLVQRALDVLGSAAVLPEDGVAALQMQAMALEKQGRVAESIAAFERALAAARTSLGDDHVMTIMLMSDTALGHASRRNLAVAEQLAREAHERANRVLPPGHSLLPLFSMRLGSVLSSVGKKAESLELQHEVVARTEAIFGQHHRNVAQAHRELAAALLGARRYEEAVVSARRALELKEKHHAGDAELETAIRGVLGGALDGLWRYEESVENWRACVARFEELGRRTDTYAFQARLGVGGGLLYLRRFLESEASLRETLELAADALPPDDAMVGFGRLLIGQAIGQQPGRLPEGYDQVAAAYEILSKHDGPGPRKRAKEALEMLESAAEGAGRPQDLERWRKLLGR